MLTLRGRLIKSRLAKGSENREVRCLSICGYGALSTECTCWDGWSGWYRCTRKTPIDASSCAVERPRAQELQPVSVVPVQSPQIAWLRSAPLDLSNRIAQSTPPERVEWVASRTGVAHSRGSRDSSGTGFAVHLTRQVPSSSRSTMGRLNEETAR
jgi:hypothetical protein